MTRDAISSSSSAPASVLKMTASNVASASVISLPAHVPPTLVLLISAPQRHFACDIPLACDFGSDCGGINKRLPVPYFEYAEQQREAASAQRQLKSAFNVIAIVPATADDAN